MRLFRRGRVSAPLLPLGPEFDVRITLRKGDKVVKRDASGAITITKVTSERLDVQEVLRVTDLRSSRRSSR